MPTRSDEDLYLSAAYRELYDRHAAPLFRFVYRFTLNRESTEEILQDIFTQLISGKFSVEQNGGLKRWLYTVAKNKSLNHLKSHVREVKDQASMESARSAVDLEAELIATELGSDLARAQAALPADLRETWRLKTLGLSYEQIADELAIPVGTVKSRFHRLLQFLKKELIHDA